MMSMTWENVLHHYRSQHFQVFTREQLYTTSIATLLQGIPASPAPVLFLEKLSQPHLSIREAFLLSVQSIYEDMQEQDIFAPLRKLLDDTTRIAILYGEHFAWKSPDKWSYLFEVIDVDDSSAKNYVIAHPPATREHIQQAEAVIGISLPSQYVQLLQATNGLGLSIDELQFICGVGNARTQWDTVETFQPGAFIRDTYHEIASYWFQWQDVLAYERQRDHETGINTFRSDERVCVPFAYTIDDWCFDRSCPNAKGEYPIMFWDHELRQANYIYSDFEAWFLDIVIHRQF